MKFSMNQVKKADPARKPLDMVKATEELADTYNRLNDAYMDLVATEGKVEVAEQVMSDCRLAYESIQRFGVTATTMAIFNGNDHTLDRALGIESLNVKALEALSVSSRKALKSQYVVGLEGAMQNGWDAFVEGLKKVLKAIVNWFKELFDKNAKYIRIVGELKESLKAGTLDGSAQVKALKKADVEKAFAVAEYLAKDAIKGTTIEANTFKLDAAQLAPIGMKLDENGRVVAGDVATVLNRDVRTVQEAGWDVGSWNAAATKFTALCGGTSIKQTAKNVAAGFDKLIADAKASSGTDDEKSAARKEACRQRKANLMVADSAVIGYASVMDLIFSTLVAVGKCKAAAPAAK